MLRFHRPGPRNAANLGIRHYRRSALMTWKITTVFLALIVMQFPGLEAFAQAEAVAEEAQQGTVHALTWSSPLVVVQCVWMLLVTAGAAAYAHIAATKNSYTDAEKELRGLNLPRGSLRGILALATIGSFVNVMVLGAPDLGENFDSVLAAFGTLTGSIVGFYFGTRGATPQPKS